MKSSWILLLLSLPCLSYGWTPNENLLVRVPAGYKVDFQKKEGNVIISEMVPESESVNNWTEMVTTQVFLEGQAITIEKFQEYMGKTWMAVCKNGIVVPNTKGKQNGYDFSFWFQGCPSNPATGKPEITWVKAIKGNDSFYVIQKAFKFMPTQEQSAQWIEYLRSSSVCDNRLADNLCPNSK